jgi:hypothetical protein
MRAADGDCGTDRIVDRLSRPSGALLLDAIVRTLWRLFVTRRRMLEWRRPLRRNTPRRCLRALPADDVAGVGSAVAAAGLLAWLAPASLPAAAPLLLAWLLSPLVAWWISRPLAPRTAPLADDGRRMLRRLARKTWAFFEHFVGPEDHWLPPDNYQEEPKGEVAHRTSPTNQGLLLIGTLAAHDLGYLTLGRLSERLQHLRHSGTAGAVRPFPELVRHAHAATADTALRLDRGQRQSARLSADARRGLRQSCTNRCRRVPPSRAD